jgi:hypothetical protein
MKILNSKIQPAENVKAESKNEKDPNYKRYAEFFSTSQVSNFDKNDLHLPDAEVDTDAPTDNRVKRSIKYRRYKFFDCCKGKLAEKYKICKLFEALYYMPVWCVLLMVLFYISLFSLTIYLAFYYGNVVNLQSYTSACSNTLFCNTEKGLYCRTKNGTSLDYCNCPAKSLSNTCDCPSSYFWNGLTCTAGIF